ncbi:Uncharacterised protein [Yersinia enterocolitica]|uniref:hypothetical protein n=1 Tax=Yersinia enterocolitica TaxID=630 RepID=UPI0005E39A61|nr:hypothetical protein [Yersinia enterocolitica]CNG64504.1 Uncharacterised protein [Yersinia enterocolitica]
MTLEQRLAAVEAELEQIKNQQKGRKDIVELMNKTITESIKKERRPGGLLYRSERRENAAIFQTAVFKVGYGDTLISSAQISAYL